MKTKKRFFGRVLVIMVMAAIVFSGCSAGMGQETGEVPANLTNTTWTRQIGDETVTLEFSGNAMKVQSNISTSVNNGIWYRNGRTQGGGCCYFGNNGYYNNSLDFQYTCYGNTLNIYGCRMQSLNGTWTRL